MGWRHREIVTVDKKPGCLLRAIVMDSESMEQETLMAKIDLDSLSIEELAALRDAATEKLAQKVAMRQSELEAELETLSQYGKLTRKSLAAPTVTKVKKGEETIRKNDEASEALVKAA
jgi:hypothetical protein